MRTTLSLDDDVYDKASALAAANRESLGHVVSEALRRAFAPATITMNKDGLPVFNVPYGANPITLEDIRRADDEEDLRYARASS